MVVDYQGQCDKYKKRHLRDSNGKRLTRYHYLFFIATDPDARGQGLASKVIQQRQQQAAKDGLPIWLEASSAHSKDVYARLGFEMVHEMKLGKGTHAASGVPEQGGPGASSWQMIWWPPKEEKS